MAKIWRCVMQTMPPWATRKTWSWRLSGSAGDTQKCEFNREETGEEIRKVSAQPEQKTVWREKKIFTARQSLAFIVVCKSIYTSAEEQNWFAFSGRASVPLLAPQWIAGLEFLNWSTGAPPKESNLCTLVYFRVSKTHLTDQFFAFLTTSAAGQGNILSKYPLHSTSSDRWDSRIDSQTSCFVTRLGHTAAQRQCLPRCLRPGCSIWPECVNSVVR